MAPFTKHTLGELLSFHFFLMKQAVQGHPGPVCVGHVTIFKSRDLTKNVFFWSCGFDNDLHNGIFRYIDYSIKIDNNKQILTEKKYYTIFSIHRRWPYIYT